MRATQPSLSTGFSLVELSIVLVILGLLVGGILGGQSLIHAAELRSVSSDLDTYRTAVYSFKDKFFALPGDMKNAVQFWGAAAGGTADGQDAACVALDETSTTSGTATCNGNGDGEIEYNNGEILRFWQHLANAGLISGHYTGLPNSSTSNRSHAGGVNCPAGRIAGSAFGIYYLEDTAVYRFPGRYGHAFLFGKTPSGYEPISPIITPEDAWNIDTKLDDGKPATGVVRPRNTDVNGHPDCTTSSDPDISEYQLGNTDNVCALHFITGL